MSIIWKFEGNNRFLSNFYPARVLFERRGYPTAENAYQAAKTLDVEMRRAFTGIPPGEAKRIGQKVPLRPFWDEIKLQVMEDIIRSKFQDEGLAKMLTDTYPQKLAEGNTWGDQFWGVTYVQFEKKWKGQNHLGRILMRVRADLL
jgi:hypothetical protein